MRLIPVLDLQGGAAVDVRGGDRRHYRPLGADLHGGSDPTLRARKRETSLARPNSILPTSTRSKRGESPGRRSRKRRRSSPGSYSISERAGSKVGSGCRNGAVGRRDGNLGRFDELESDPRAIGTGTVRLESRPSRRPADRCRSRVLERSRRCSGDRARRSTKGSRRSFCSTLRASARTRERERSNFCERFDASILRSNGSSAAAFPVGRSWSNSRGRALRRR